MKRILLALWLSLALLLTLSATALAYSATVEIGGVDVAVGEYWNNASGNTGTDSANWNAKFTYDATDGYVLTLRNAVIDSGTSDGIYFSESADLTVILKGENHITATGSGYDGIHADAGALKVKGGQVIVNAGDDCLSGYYGVSVENCKLEFTSDYGIYSSGGAISVIDSNVNIAADSYGLDNNADATIENSTVNIKTGYGGIYANGNTRINNSAVTITSEGDGIYVDEGNLDITDSTLTITSEDNGIYVYEGNLDITDSTVTITSDYYGIACTAGNITVTDSDITASGYSYTIYAYGTITFDNSSADVVADDGGEDVAMAISTWHYDSYEVDGQEPDILLIDTEIIQGGTIQSAAYSSEYWWCTFSEEEIMESESDASPHVILGAENNDIEALSKAALLGMGMTFLGVGQSFPFADVPLNHWAYAYISDAYKQNLIDGKSATLYQPDSSLTYAEAIKLAACIHQLMTVGSVTTEVGIGNPWYAPYVSYAELNGIINKGQFADKYNQPVSRYDFALIFAKALPDGYYTPKYSYTAITDVPAANSYLPYALKLYNAGIINGQDTSGSFGGASPVKRSEVAAIVVRMIDSEKRL